MGVHENYVKELFRDLVGDGYVSDGHEVVVKFPGDEHGITGRIDGVVNGRCAVEIESRTDKQIRGALLDLAFHSLPKKLLIIVPVHMHDPDKTVRHCEAILKAICPGKPARVIKLDGSGDDPQDEHDRSLLESALASLGCS